LNLGFPITDRLETGERRGFLCPDGGQSAVSSGISFNAGVFVPDCLKEGLLRPAIVIRRGAVNFSKPAFWGVLNVHFDGMGVVPGRRAV
jgi:hypothetical protein